MATAGAPLVSEEAQATAKAMGQKVAEHAKVAGAKIIGGMHAYIQGGPAGVSVMCFLTGSATAVIGFLNIINIFGALTSPFTYLLNSYLCIFGIVSFLLEVDVDRVKSLPGFASFADIINDYHEKVCDYAKFLTLLKGRGLFYVFVGSFAITQMSFLLVIVGCANLVVGVLCFMLGFGYAGDEISQAVTDGYAKVASNVTAGAGAPGVATA